MNDSHCYWRPIFISLSSVWTSGMTSPDNPSCRWWMAHSVTDCPFSSVYHLCGHRAWHHHGHQAWHVSPDNPSCRWWMTHSMTDCPYSSVCHLSGRRAWHQQTTPAASEQLSIFNSVPSVSTTSRTSTDDPSCQGAVIQWFTAVKVLSEQTPAWTIKHSHSWMNTVWMLKTVLFKKNCHHPHLCQRKKPHSLWTWR